MWTAGFAWIPFACGCALLARSALALWRADEGIWPPKGRDSAAYMSFIVLFRGLVWGLVVLTAVSLAGRLPPSVGPRELIGGVLAVVGFGVAFGATYSLGWAKAFGEDKGLKVDGMFRFSRNPIYLATWLGLAGWAALIPEPPVLAALGTWAILYVLAIPLEERALAATHGDTFEQYRRSTHRILGWPKPSGDPTSNTFKREQ